MINDIRRCKTHGQHGILYVCPDYPPELQAKIREQAKKFIESCRSGEIEVVHFDENGKELSRQKLKNFKGE